MRSILLFCIFLPMLFFKLALACLDGECRELSFPPVFFFADKHLANHTIKIERVPDFDTCEFICYQVPNCVSINFNMKASADGTFSCELNNATHRRYDDEFVDRLGYLYLGTESACDEDHCHNNAFCQSGFTDKKYRCLCPSGFTGEHCEIDINECATEEHSCSNDAVCHNTEGSHDCTCKPGYTGDGRNCSDINECEEGIHNCVTDDGCINSNGSYRCTVPVAVALFPLNATYGTQEINNRTAQGIPSNVHLAPGPNGKANGSYEFLGTSDSYIEFHNTAGGPLDVRESITMLCWLHHGGQTGPIFTYKTSGSSWGVQLYVYEGKLYVRFNKRDYSATETETLIDTTPVAGGWKFVGASYDHVSGEAKLWVDGVVVQNKTVGAGLQLATQDSIRMGVKSGNPDYFKGRITQMQVYNESLTQEQIRTIQRRTPRD